MHRALFIDEILDVIFDHCDLPSRLGFWSAEGRSCRGTDLVALAATCHVFEEPALDSLWAELRDQSAFFLMCTV